LEIILLDRVDSTQKYLLRLLKDSKIETPVAVVSKEQTDGIGSRDNTWQSNKGNFFLSFAIDIDLLPNDLPLISSSIYFTYIFNMTLKEYIEYIETELSQDAIDIVYKTPKLILIDNKLKVLDKRLETFFNIDTDIDRNNNIKKAYNYGYTKSEIAKYLLISHTAVSKILKKGYQTPLRE